MEMVTFNLVEGVARINFKYSGDHENFQELNDAWKHCKADLKEIGQESGMQKQRSCVQLDQAPPAAARVQEQVGQSGQNQLMIQKKKNDFGSDETLLLVQRAPSSGMGAPRLF